MFFKLSTTWCNYLPENKGMQTRDFSHSNTLTRYAKPPCIAARPASLCSFIALLDDVIGT